MPEVLIVSDSALVRAEVRSSLPDESITVRELTRGAEVRESVRKKAPDLAVLDLQIGKMGGMATCLDLRLEESGGRLPHIPVLMLVDRRADVFLARRSGAEGWVGEAAGPAAAGAGHQHPPRRRPVRGRLLRPGQRSAFLVAPAAVSGRIRATGSGAAW